MSPRVSSSARLQSIILACVVSRSCLTSAGVGLYATSLTGFLACGWRFCRRCLGLGCRNGLGRRLVAAGLGRLGLSLLRGSLALAALTALAVLRDEVRHLDAAVPALGNAVRQDAHDERRRTEGVVVSGDHEVGVVGVAV